MSAYEKAKSLLGDLKEARWVGGRRDNRKPNPLRRQTRALPASPQRRPEGDQYLLDRPRSLMAVIKVTKNISTENSGGAFSSSLGRRV